MNRNDYENILYERYTDGINKGRSEGHAEGRAEGHAEGRAVGAVDGKTEVARNMMKEGMDIEQISRLTGLPQEQIAALR